MLGIHSPLAIVSMRMKSLLLPALAALALVTALPAAASGVLDHHYRRLASQQPVHLASAHAGQVLLVVNTASQCGYTGQYAGLEALHQRLAPRGFAVIGFPSNDFRGQEPGSEAEIAAFCTNIYGVRFPMYEKVRVTGAQATGLYRELAAATGVAPGWNFHKYLVGRDGRVVAQFPSATTPEDPALLQAIERALAAPRPQARAGGGL